MSACACPRPTMRVICGATESTHAHGRGEVCGVSEWHHLGPARAVIVRCREHYRCPLGHGRHLFKLSELSRVMLSEITLVSALSCVDNDRGAASLACPSPLSPGRDPCDPSNIPLTLPLPSSLHTLTPVQLLRLEPRRSPSMRGAQRWAPVVRPHHREPGRVRRQHHVDAHGQCRRAQRVLAQPG